MKNYIQNIVKNIVKNITLFKILTLTVAFTLFYYIIKTLFWTLSVLKFRLISITGSYYYFNILGALKGRIIPIWEKLVK